MKRGGGRETRRGFIRRLIVGLMKDSTPTEMSACLDCTCTSTELKVHTIELRGRALSELNFSRTTPAASAGITHKDRTMTAFSAGLKFKARTPMAYKSRTFISSIPVIDRRKVSGCRCSTLEMR